jgi:HSP20 family protein
MLSLNRWTPFAELSGLHRDLDSLFGRFLGNESMAVGSGESFAPAADVTRDGDKWRISMAVPGVAPENMTIDVVGRTLHVRGERTMQKDETAEPVVGEIRYGRFEREFTLPEEIDSEKVQATYRHGMLELTLPLKESAKPHRIEIQTAPETKQLQAA